MKAVYELTLAQALALDLINSTITLLIRLNGKTGCRDGECSLS
jgi:hypothetical protein